MRSDLARSLRGLFERKQTATPFVAQHTVFEEECQRLDFLIQTMPVYLRAKAVDILRNGLNPTVINGVRLSRTYLGPRWYTMYAGGWGMQVLTMLTNNGVDNTVTPTGRLVDYWAQLVEIVAGIRDEEGNVIDESC